MSDPAHPITTQQFLPLAIPSHVQAARARGDDPENHHLRQKPSGLFQFRIMIDRGPKYVGERIVLGLGTRDEEQARERRDVVMSALKRAGYLLEAP